jgi:peptide/nickel transport system permease protein
MKQFCSSRLYSSLWGKVLIFIITMFILSVAVFYVSRLAPGDPLQAFYGERVEQMSASEHEAARQRLGLDGPVYVQYGIWLDHAAHGEFGISYKYKEPAVQVVGALLGNTLFLGTIAYTLVFLLAIVLALCCARYEDTWIDKAICKIGTIAYYLPPFWVGLLLILVFNVNLGWLPGSGAYDPGHSQDIVNRLEHILLPLVVMVSGHVWYYAYMIRNKLLHETRQDYVLLAKSKGLSRWGVLCRHCLRNTAPTIVSIMAISVNHILGGTYVVEAVFSYPGIGSLSIESAKYHDYNLLMLIVLLTGAMVIASGLLAQTVNEHIDPRMRITEGESPWKTNPPSVS